MWELGGFWFGYSGLTNRDEKGRCRQRREKEMHIDGDGFEEVGYARLGGCGCGVEVPS